MNVFLISLFVATLAVASFANVVPRDDQNSLPLNESKALEAANATTTLDLSEALAELLDAYKNVMQTGNATYGIPQMAPFRSPSVKVNFTGEHLSLKGEIENLVISGLDDYLIVQLTTNASTNRTELDMIYKDIQILGKFNLKVQADVAGFKFVQPLEGYVNLQVLNMRVSSGLNIGQNEAGGIKLSNLEYTLQVGDIVVNNLNTQWSVAVNNFANQYVRDFSMLFLQTNRESFGKMYSQAVTEMANQALYNVPYDTLNTYLMGAIELLKSMN